MQNLALERLRAYIKSKDITIKHFAESINIPEGTFKTMFSRQANPSFELLEKASIEYLDFPLRWIITGSNFEIEKSDFVSEPVSNYSTDSSFEKKYYKMLEENSRLKDKIIELQEKLAGKDTAGIA